MFHMTTKIYRNIKRSVLAHYLSPQGVKCATPPNKTCARTFVYGLGCIFLICCPNLMFNTSICMDVDGELIKRQNITLQINFHCLVDLQIIFLTPQNPKTNVVTPIFYCRNRISVQISIETEIFRRFWPLIKVWENFLCNILLILLDATKFHGARVKIGLKILKIFWNNLFKMFFLSQWYP